MNKITFTFININCIQDIAGKKYSQEMISLHVYHSNKAAFREWKE